MGWADEDEMAMVKGNGNGGIEVAREWYFHSTSYILYFIRC